MIICQGGGDFSFLKNSLLHKEYGVGKQLSTRLIYQYYVDLDKIWEGIFIYFISYNMIHI